MRVQSITKKAASLFSEASFIAHIDNESDYQSALELMDNLFENYATNKPLIEVLAVAIARWENTADAFTDFNAQLKNMNEVDVLKFLIEEHQLGIADLPEIGSPSLVSKILNGRDRQLTKNHIKALSARFGLSPAVFFNAGTE